MEGQHCLNKPEHHALSDKWVLWAHLPHDTDWSLKSYIKLMELSTMEEIISLNNCVNVFN